MSGIGRQLGPEGIDTFRETKMIMIDPERSSQDFWWFPYADEEMYSNEKQKNRVDWLVTLCCICIGILYCKYRQFLEHVWEQFLPISMYNIFNTIL